VGIAIIDQPMRRDHEEYRAQLTRYEPVDVEGATPYMHGPAVAGSAVGKSCGVAPGAALYFFAVPTGKWTRDEPYAEQLDRILEMNRGIKDTPRIKVVSISVGAFSQRPNFERWQQAVRKAEEQGILVVTCDPTFLRIQSLKRNEERSGSEAEDYGSGLYSFPGSQLAVPSANRTIASWKGPRAYTYDRNQAMSWTVPYLAGLAALACQVNSTIQPKDVVQLWRETATRTKAGPVVNPAAFIEAVKAKGASGAARPGASQP
jgi:hypothetical protein